jgi:hypothetical protein
MSNFDRNAENKLRAIRNFMANKEHAQVHRIAIPSRNFARPPTSSAYQIKYTKLQMQAAKDIIADYHIGMMKLAPENRRRSQKWYTSQQNEYARYYIQAEKHLAKLQQRRR